MKFLLPLALCVASAVLSSCGKGDSPPGGSAPGGNSPSGGATASGSASADKGPPDVPPKGPATPAEAARTLDLNTMTAMGGGSDKDTKVQHTIANFSCVVKGTVKDVYEFYRKQLADQRWKIGADSYVSDDSASSTFSRNTFFVSLTVSPTTEPGIVNVAIHNHGNVDLSKLPRPPISKTTYEGAVTAMYVSDAPVAATAEACRDLLLKAGWQVYGASAGDTSYYKQNGIRLTVTVSAAPAEGGKTMISYFGEQMSADIPVLPDAQDARYIDDMRRLSFEMAVPKKAVATQYQELLAKDGWKSTTDNLITNEGKGFMIFREPGGGMLSLDIKDRGDGSMVYMSYTTFAEYKEMEKKFDERKAAEKKP